MLTLPSDIQLLVLDHIRLPSHLKALCLTSKACCTLATPYLYRKIILNFTDTNLLNRFDRCMQAGARKHVEATRSLTLTDSDPIDEPIEVQSRPNRPPYDPRYLARASKGVIQSILDNFPPNCLHSFRWLSTKPFDAQMLEKLCQDQKDTLKHIHITVKDLRAVRNLAHVKTMDIWCSQIHLLENFRGTFKELFSQLNSYNHMEKLFLGVDDWHRSGEFLTKCFQNLAISSDRLGSLREISLQNIDLSVALYRSMAKIIDFTQLTHLTLWDCDLTLDFCSELVQANNTYKLEHLALDINASRAHRTDKSLELLLNNCTKLKSLCLDWKRFGDWWPERLIKSLDKIGKGLKLLSLQSWNSDHEDTMLPDHFKRICSACPNLEQLGYCISDKYFAYQYSMEFYENLEPIIKLANLRTLHLRQRFLEPITKSDANETFAANIALRQRWFAESFFRHLQERSACRNFEAIIIGFERQFGTDFDAGNNQPYSIPRCYRRGHMIDQYGSVQHVPYLVGLPEFRATSEYAEILDWCSEWSSSNIWMWRVPGRFNDD